MSEEQRRKITSDVPSGIAEHTKAVHRWAEKHVKHVPGFFIQCFKCSRNSDHCNTCPHLGETVTSEEPCPDFILHRYMPNCGMCAAYKTTFCTFHAMEGYINKTDAPCSDFALDRHLNSEGELRSKARKMSFAEKVENL